MSQRTTDTIAAIATPPGVGGIGIIRISGISALSILQSIFTPKYPLASFESHKLYYGTVCNSSGQVLDEVLAVYMQGPGTYTREDVVELQCHGSYLLLQTILSAVFSFGARPAEAGEFTKRAFLGGRLDLTQAEAVIDLLQAQTDKGIYFAVHQLQGQLTEVLEPLRRELVEMLAVLEVAIDFPDDDVELIDAEQMKSKMKKNVLVSLEQLIESGAQGKIIRDGISVVIAGRPNVGKSSLLNSLLREERALVTALPGTTRDTIEETISIRGIPVHLIDTAGIRAHQDVVEELGMERARQKMETADLLLFLVDGSEPLTTKDEELYAGLQDKKHIIVINKIDKSDEQQLKDLHSVFSGQLCIRIGAKDGTGINELQELIYEQVTGDQREIYERAACAPNIRHLAILKKTREACLSFLMAVEEGASCDLLAVEAQAALDYLGDIVGITTPEDVLDTIFAEFCIGK